MTYLEDGGCSLSNNLSENSIRPVNVGRKNGSFPIHRMELLPMPLIFDHC